jgi:hypothetical protein
MTTRSRIVKSSLPTWPFGDDKIKVRSIQRGFSDDRARLGGSVKSLTRFGISKDAIEIGKKENRLIETEPRAHEEKISLGVDAQLLFPRDRDRD